MRIRRIVGAVWMINFVLVVIYVVAKPDDGVTYNHPWLLTVAGAGWLVSTPFVKIAMIFEKKWPLLNALAVFSFIIMSAVILRTGCEGSGRELSPVLLWTGTFWIFGGFLIDCLDLINCFLPFTSRPASKPE